MYDFHGTNIFSLYSSFALPEQEEKALTCNTEKDGHGRLNYRTAG